MTQRHMYRLLCSTPGCGRQLVGTIETSVLMANDVRSMPIIDRVIFCAGWGVVAHNTFCATCFAIFLERPQLYQNPSDVVQAAQRRDVASRIEVL